MPYIRDTLKTSTDPLVIRRATTYIVDLNDTDSIPLLEDMLLELTRRASFSSFGLDTYAFKCRLAAAHALGKLLKYVGKSNVLWGTDSIWYGSPQDQIQAFRVFQISEALQDAHGYPALTPEIRAGVFGLNATRPYRISVDEVLRRAANDPVERRRQAARERPEPSFLTHGPKTRREFLNLLRWNGGARV